MKPQQQITFAPFQLDLGNECLWRKTKRIPLRPKTFAVLCYLVERAGQLVTKEELMRAVWQDVYVSDVVPMVCIRELRKALGDTPKTPRFIETVHRRGYRFIAALAASPLAHRTKSQPASNCVGRDAELAQLKERLEQARQGQRQVVFITGEAGIGKTTFVDAFLKEIAIADAVSIARGQCLEQYGTREAYLPVLDALDRLCHEPEGEHVVELLSREAPTWLVHLPWFIDAANADVLQAKIIGATKQRMLREIAAVVERLAAERPLILWLEDIHWSDYSTLDFISFLAQRTEPAQLLLLCTYRPAEVLSKEHPLRMITQELEVHRQGEELALECLTEAAIQAYLATRFTGSRQVTELAPTLHRWTEGNPLFLVNVVDHLIAQGLIVRTHGRWKRRHAGESIPENIIIDVPKSLRQMIERQIEALSLEEQGVLEAASVAGEVFSAAALEAGLEDEEGEEKSEALARRGQFLQAQGAEEWPDGTIASRYCFIHTLYQRILYDRVPSGKRVQLHQKIGERKEQGYQKHTRDRAVELAIHFEQGRDYSRAARYLQQAAEKAVERYAYREATEYLNKGLSLLESLPHTSERPQQELMLRITLGVPLTATKGYAAPEVQKTYLRIRDLCQQVGETPQLFLVLAGLWGFHLVRAELETARELAEQRLQLAHSTQDPALLLLAYLSLGITSFYQGELVAAQTYLEQGLSLYDPKHYRSYADLYELDPGVACLSYAAWALCLLGYPDQARDRMGLALCLAEELAHPHNLAAAHSYAAWLHHFRREQQSAHDETLRALRLSQEQGFVQWLAVGNIMEGWVLAEQGQEKVGIAQICQSIEAYQTTGAELSLSYSLALLTEAYRTAGQVQEGLTALSEALSIAHKNGERYYEAELHRLKGELLLKAERTMMNDARKIREVKTSHAEAEVCFQHAIDLARHQSAKLLELRAVMSVSRLWKKQGKRKEARQILTEVYSRFTEGFETGDVQEAKALLGELGR